MINKKEEKALRRKHRKEKDQRQSSKSGNATIYRLMSSEAPLHGCWLNQDWQAAGFACALIVRKMATGLLMCVMFWMNTAKGQMENCFGSINLTEEALQRNILHREGMEFLRADIELVKGVIATVVAKMEAKEEELPEHYHDCLKLVGSIEKYLQPPEEEVPTTAPPEKPLPSIVYTTPDAEVVETELFQLPMLKESEESLPGRRRFVWSVPKRKFLFSKDETCILGYLTLQGDRLVLEVVDEAQIKSLHSTLIKYLGTNISWTEKCLS
jgi:hypothetical protein